MDDVVINDISTQFPSLRTGWLQAMTRSLTSEAAQNVADFLCVLIQSVCSAGGDAEMSSFSTSFMPWKGADRHSLKVLKLKSGGRGKGRIKL